MIRLLPGQKYAGTYNVRGSSAMTFTLPLSRVVKRLFDVVFSFIGFVLLSPFFVYVAYLIRRDSPGPAFFWGSRAGEGGKAFKMLKFRTMYESEKSYDGPCVTCKQDER